MICPENKKRKEKKEKQKEEPKTEKAPKEKKEKRFAAGHQSIFITVSAESENSI